MEDFIEGYRDNTPSYIYKSEIINNDKIAWSGVNTVAARTTANGLYVYQTGGYDDNRGMFIDFY